VPTVLIVDDDARSREPVAKMLRVDGYDVIRVANGKEAFAALETESVDLILLDFLMPEMDGLTFLRNLRKDARWTHLPVIMVSGVSEGAAMRRAHRFGVKDYLIKSRFSITDLLEHIRWNLGPQTGAITGGELSFA
jgi:DNA-binding response OmpR family regulator